jgi:hypothetical protein
VQVVQGVCIVLNRRLRCRGALCGLRTTQVENGLAVGSLDGFSITMIRLIRCNELDRPHRWHHLRIVSMRIVISMKIAVGIYMRIP